VFNGLNTFFGGNKMNKIFNSQKNELISLTSEELKNIDEIKPTEWSLFVKTGVNKERPPIQKDWWYIRSASILIKVMNLGPIGVSKLRVKYGGRKRRGHKPNEFRKASGNIIRKILQQLEKAELIKKDEKSGHKGKIITGKGVSLLNKVAKNLTKEDISKETSKKEVKSKEN
jgi:small subunit ribosomal protein S19e